MPKLRRILLFMLLSLVVLTGCSTQSPAEQQTKELQTVQSWLATAHMTSDAWTNNAVPTAYARSTLQTAQQSIQDSLDTLTHAAAPAPLLVAVREVAQVVGTMATAVDQNDRAALQKQTAVLAMQEQTIGALAKREGQ